jgi:excisionase family DNA binding protein
MNEIKTKRKLITINQAKDLVHVSRRTIYNWIKKNKIKTIKLASGRQLIYEDSLFQEDYINHD